MPPPPVVTTGSAGSTAGSTPTLLSPAGKPAHLQPLDSPAWHANNNSNGNNSIPTTPKSNLGPAGMRSSAEGLQHSASNVSVASFSQTLQRQQQQQQQGPEADDNIKVVVRVRPLFPGEVAKGAASVISVAEDSSSLQVVVPGPGGATMQRDFSFHACLGPEVNQADVMETCGIHQLLDAALAGYHVTIFAYGQTGSGKTHTMSGHEDIISDDSYNGHDKDGIISRAVQYLFHQVNTKRDAKYSLKASYLEIYNEGVYDLVHFSPKAKSLPVKWDASYGFYVQGLKVVPCSQQRTMMEVIRTGMKHRKVGSHQLNMESSRSHAIFTVYCDATPTDPTSYDYGTIRYGKLSFVDLAGSERVKDSKSEGTMLKETININKSLSVLGKVILALAEQGSAGTTAHVPYRDSKLTKLLMDSLGGSALTLMVACCSPSSLQVEETLSTLSYATRTKNIHNRPTVQYDPREAQISLLRREIELLRQENNLLKEQMRAGTGAGSVNSSVPTTPDGSPSLAGTGKRTLGPLPPGSPGSSRGASPSPRAQLGARSPSPQLGSAADAVGGLRANSSPNMQRLLGARPGAASPVLPAGYPIDQQLRTSMNDNDLRANAARHAAAAASGSSPNGGGNSSSGALTSHELMRRLRDTQALLLKTSEENGRLSADNQMLQAGRKQLGVEHASVLDEIDLLRGKLSQLEHNVLSAAAASATGGSGTVTPGSAAPAGTGAGAASKHGAGALDLRSLLQSLGLGEEVIGGLAEVGVGPLGPAGGGDDDVSQEQHQPGSSQGWQQQGLGAADVTSSRSSRTSMLQPNSSTRSTFSATGGGSSSSAGGNNNSSMLAAAGPPAMPPQGRSVLGGVPSATRTRPTPLSASSSTSASRGLSAAEPGAPGLGGGVSASSRSPSPAGMLSAGRSVNRTPLLNKAAGLEPRDDSIIVGNPAGLAVLLGDVRGAHPQQRSAAGPAAGAGGKEHA